MPLPKDFSEKVIAALQRKLLKSPVCPLCGNENWFVQEDPTIIFLVMQDDLKLMKMSGKGLPLIPITCTNCGNTHFMNALYLGLEDLLVTGKGE